MIVVDVVVNWRQYMGSHERTCCSAAYYIDVPNLQWHSTEVVDVPLEALRRVADRKMASGSKVFVAFLF